VAGVHVYAGSYSFEKVGIAIARAVHGIISKLQELLATPIEFVNLGGGFSENWMVSDTFPSYVKEVCRLQERVTVVHESGRAIFSECGVFVTKVIAVKTIDDRVIVVSDGGLAHAFLLAQTEKVIKNRAVPYVVRRGNAPILSTTQRIDVVGSSCNQSDIIGHLPPGEVPAVGDDLIFWDCGSYHTYTPTGFLNLRPVGRFIIS
jgi:diaminopimelate decarboxylase